MEEVFRCGADDERGQGDGAYQLRRMPVSQSARLFHRLHYRERLLPLRLMRGPDDCRPARHHVAGLWDE